MDIQLRGYLVSNEDADVLRWWGWKDLTSPQDFAAALKEAKGEKVTVLVNSPGGDMTVGGEIYSMLRRYTGGAEALFQGYGASAATMAVGGCKAISSEPGAILCYHNPSAIAEGDYRAMSLTSESLKNVRESVLGIYLAWPGCAPREQLEELMDKNVWISPAQALALGLIDRVEGLQEGTPAPAGFAAAAGLYPRITEAMRQKYRDAAADKTANEKANRARALLRALANF